MDQVSSFLENFLTVEPSELNGHTQNINTSPTVRNHANASDQSQESTPVAGSRHRLSTSSSISLSNENSFAQQPKQPRHHRHRSSSSSTDNAIDDDHKKQQSHKNPGNQQSSKPQSTVPELAGTRASAESHANPKNISQISSFWYLNSNDDPSTKSSLMTDKLFEKVISMMIPVTTEEKRIINDRIVMQQQRPPLSINIMSRNSIQLTQRLSGVFKCIDSIIKFVGWYNPYYTVGVLLIITHIILNPYLIFSLPIILLLQNVLIPHYLTLYPPDSSMIDHQFFESNPAPYGGPAPLMQYKPPKPVPEFSKEFVLNLTDLQNHMVIYIKAYDFVVWLLNDYLYFKDEDISSLVYLFLFGVSLYSLVVLPKILPVVVKLFPVKLLLIINVWTAVGLCHPSCRETLLDFIYNEDTRISTLYFMTSIEKFWLKFIYSSTHYPARDNKSRANVSSKPASTESSSTTPGEVAERDSEIFEKMDIKQQQDEAEEIKWVEIYELHKLNNETKIWELVGFSNDFFTINNPIRKLSKNVFEEYDEELLPPLTTSDSSAYANLSQINESNPASSPTASSPSNLANDPSDSRYSYFYQRFNKSKDAGINATTDKNINTSHQSLQEDFTGNHQQQHHHTNADVDESSLIQIRRKPSLAEIQPPVDWQFTEGTNWQLDLDVNEWVAQELIQDLVSIDTDEKWVYDFIDNNDGQGNEHENPNGPEDRAKDVGKGNDQFLASTSSTTSSPELSTTLPSPAQHSRSVYRRRRWVRSCQRESQKPKQRTGSVGDGDEAAYGEGTNGTGAYNSSLKRDLAASANTRGGSKASMYSAERLSKSFSNFLM